MNTKKLFAWGFAFAALCLVAVVGEPAMAAQAIHLDAHSYFSEAAGAGMALAGLGRIKLLRDKKSALLKEADAINVKIDDGDASEDDVARLAAITDDGGDLDQANVSISREEKLMAQKRNMAPVVDINEDTDEEIEAKAPALPKKEADAFSSFGEQLQAVAHAGMNKGGSYDNRLVYQAAASGANEAVPSEGGFLVQQDYSTTMLDLMHEMGEVVSRVRRIPISVGNGIKLPAIDETSRANGSRFGGVQAYWADEAGTVAASKPKFRTMELSLEKLMAVGYATEELLADAPALESVMTSAFTEELTFKTEDAIINGTGAGQPLGILNSGATVSVSKQSGQAAATIVTQNILDMWARTPIRSRRNLVWVVNQDIEPQLFGLTLGSGTAVVLLYTPPGVNGNNSPYGLLMGRPVIPIEYAATLGTVGDMILFDPMSYVMIDKNGVSQASSMHLRFLYDEMTFRFTYRVDGQPVWNSPVTPYKGSNTISPYITLATRA